MPGTALLQDFIAVAAHARPDSSALAMGEERLSYAQLAELSDGLAAHLAELGCRPGDRVALLAPKQPLAIVALQAVLKAGCIYVPLDADSPAPRLGRILASAEPAAIVSVPECAELLDELGAATAALPVVSLGDAFSLERSVASSRADWQGAGRPGAAAVGADAPAYLLFTSGSTGDPKGVVVTHRSVIAFAEWCVRTFEIGPDERLSQHPALHFDLSTLDLYAAFAAGAALHLVPPKAGLDPRALTAMIRDQELTQWVSVPTVLSYMVKFEAIGAADLPSLRRLLWCGEVLPTPTLAELMRRLPHVRFANLYGPTEATVASSFYVIPEVPGDESKPVPIGVACEGEELLVLDGEMEPIGSGEVGDLYIGGVGLSPGYWRDEERTAAAFLPDPRDPGGAARLYRTGDLARIDEEGLFEFVGRADTQVKSRGYRIELGEIETALASLEGIEECAVVGMDTGGFEGTSICAAYVGAPGIEPPALRRGLAELLPTYMLPARWLGFAELPQNQNGKVDRNALRARFEQAESERVGVRG